MYKVFIVSDTHGLKDELLASIKTTGCDLENKHHILVLNGDIVDQTMDFEQMDILIDELIKLNKNNNVIHIKGNHEVSFAKLSKRHQMYLNNLPIAYVTDNLFICHGWFNPRWTIKQHLNQRDDSLYVGNFGDMLNGSPACIFTREIMHSNYFGYSNFKEYEDTLLNMFPDYKFIYGHYFNFMWSYPPAIGLHYFQYRDELNKFKNNQHSIIHDVIENFNYKEPFINQHRNIYCIDVYTKCYTLGLPYYIKIVEFASKLKGLKIYEQDNSNLNEIISKI